MIHTVDTIFHNRYQLRKIIGSGGMSSVWLASDILSETEVAVKIYNYEGDLNWKVKEAFVNEFKIMYNITHSYLFRPSHYDIDPGSQSPYLVSKYYPKGSAETIINTTNKALDENFIAEFMHDAASALNYLHSASIPIIHQDIKPDNFLFSASYFPSQSCVVSICPVVSSLIFFKS